MPDSTRASHLTIEECAERLGVSPWTVRRRITDGSIKAVRIGRLIRIPEQSFGGEVQPWSQSVKPEGWGQTPTTDQESTKAIAIAALSQLSDEGVEEVVMAASWRRAGTTAHRILSKAQTANV